MAGELGSNMTWAQLEEVVGKVRSEHAWPMRGHGIKYVRPHIATQSGEIFGIGFDCIRGNKDFFVINEDRNRNLYDWVMEFLNTHPDQVQWAQS